ncbi:15430_t:CDS:1, partial [Entrophospora sp. SA101]
IEEDRIAHQAAETSRQETILKVVSQTLSTNTAKLLETTVRNEIQINVLPSLSKMVIYIFRRI